MADTVDVAFVHAFHDLIVSLYAEDPMGLRETVRVRTNVIGKTDHWERIGGTELVPVTNRHQSTPHTEMTHTRRRLSLADYAGAEYRDTLDQVKMMIDPRNEYTQNLVRAWRVRVAKTLVVALNASSTVVANDDTTTTSALPASQQIANGGTGMTMTKLRQANRILDNAGVPPDDRALLLSAFAVEDLMADSQVTSSDYSTLNAIQNGTIPQGARFMGFRIIKIGDAVPDDTAVLTGGTASPILPKTGNIRSLFAYHKTAMGLSVGREATPEIDKRPDLMNAWQVLVQGSLGAVRVLDAGVVQIDIDESV